MSASRRGGPIFILKTAFKNINQAQINVNLGFSLKCCKVHLKMAQTRLQTTERQARKARLHRSVYDQITTSLQTLQTDNNLIFIYLKVLDVKVHY